MKRIIFLNIIIISSLYSQDSTSYNLGIKIGINLSYITGALHSQRVRLEKGYSKPGLCIGFIFDKKTNSPTSYQVELLYNKTGTMFGRGFIVFPPPGGDNVVYNLKYITLAGYFKLKSKIGDLIKDFDFVIGGAYSYNFVATQEWYIENFTFKGPKDIRNEINRHEVGIIYGIKFPFGNRKYYLNLLFYHGLTTLYPDSNTRPDGDFSSKRDMRNNTFSISFDAFLFGFK
jgi:hypothetical protein